MDEQKKPRAREKRVVNEGKGLRKYGEGLGTGPVGNNAGYEDRLKQEKERLNNVRRPDASTGSETPKRPSFGSAEPPQRTGNDPFAFRPQSTQNRPQGSPFPPFGQTSSGQKRPASGTKQQSYHSATKQNGTGNGPQRATGSGTGGGKLILVIIAAVLLFGGGSISGLFGGGNQGSNGTSILQNISSGIGNSSQTDIFDSVGGQGGSIFDSILGQGNSTSYPSGGQSGSLTGSGSIGNLLSAFLGSGSSSVYDFTGTGSLGTGSGSVSSNSSSQQYFTSATDDNTPEADETVSRKAREKYTTIKGGGKDKVTILVYMCGTDLESKQGMATADLKEMVNATLNDNVTILVYTGGCTRWRNNVVSSQVNQIYQIKNGGLYCLEKDLGRESMVNPETLASFIRYGTQKEFKANRLCLILWDHGGGSISGYGYDEKVGHSQSMTLAGINNALKKADVKFDFIGFDACLMATVENGIMLSQYADYMIASEETEPGVGWYYTNWLTRLSKNTSMPTVQVGKIIADDFVDVCSQKCRGQATTLSVVDLAELQATVPDELKTFSIGTNELIQNKEYKTVSGARSKAREFAQQSRIDQIDLAHFATNMGTKEGKSLAKAVKSAVKYNRTGGGITNAYGLSIYFPYKQTRKVNQMVNTYKAIGMDEEYTRCIQEFASLEVSGQVSAGTQLSWYGSQNTAAPGLMDSLLGQGGYTSGYSAGGLNDLLGGMFGSGSTNGSTGSILDLFMGRTMTADKAAEYILENHFDASQLVWIDNRITLPKEQWAQVESVIMNVFYDDGSGFIDLGTDNIFTLEGDSLVSDFDNTWISIDRQPVAYYYMGTIEEGNQYVISGYVPALLNGERVKLILNFDSERPEGYIAGALKDYTDDQSMTQAKMMISIGEGDRVQFICDYYNYDGSYKNNYKLGKEMTLGKTVEIVNTPISSDISRSKVTYCFTDFYQQRYWTPVAPVK